LIIDDNVKIRGSLAKNLEQYGYESLMAHSGREAIELLPPRRIDVVLLDIVLGDESGLDLLVRLKSIHDTLPVIVITGYASIETAIRAIKVGAFDYLQKPLDLNKLIKTMENAIAMTELAVENLGLKRRLEQFTGSLVTESPKMRELCEAARRMALTDLPILICGENGTGKEVLADYIYFQSSRRARELQKMNCASFPETLLDNELFGHEQGAYTGADSRSRGVFARADGGTLFLDEIGDMALGTQAKILRATQNNEIRRIGGSENISVDVRFMAATNKDLEDLIRKG
jgi:DNA-binding NtrC family response regulator